MYLKMAGKPPEKALSRAVYLSTVVDWRYPWKIVKGA
jgi:hypothetical protein